MSEAWRAAGAVTVTSEGSITFVRITGNFHRDLATADRDRIKVQLEELAGPALLLDLSDLLRVDSWAEDVVADVFDDLIAEGGHVAVMDDPDRPHLLRSMRMSIREHEATGRVRVGSDESELRTWLTGVMT